MMTYKNELKRQAITMLFFPFIAYFLPYISLSGVCSKFRNSLLMFLLLSVLGFLDPIYCLLRPLSSGKGRSGCSVECQCFLPPSSKCNGARTRESNVMRRRRRVSEGETSSRQFDILIDAIVCRFAEHSTKKWTL